MVDVCCLLLLGLLALVRSEITTIQCSRVLFYRSLFYVLWWENQDSIPQKALWTSLSYSYVRLLGCEKHGVGKYFFLVSKGSKLGTAHHPTGTALALLIGFATAAAAAAAAGVIGGRVLEGSSDCMQPLQEGAPRQDSVTQPSLIIHLRRIAVAKTPECVPLQNDVCLIHATK